MTIRTIFSHPHGKSRALVNLKIVMLGLILLFSYSLSGKETGYKFIKNYTYHDYDHQAQNWAVTQDKNTGLIYVANLGGILVYDGNHWQLVNIPNHSVRSMAFGADGKLYIGGNNEVGYLVQDLNDALKYVSLLEQFNYFDMSGKQFGTVWQTVATSEGVFFRTSKCLYQWNYKKMSVLVNEYCYSIMEHNDILFIQQKDTGLMRMVNGKLQLIPGGELFEEDKIWVMDTYGINENSNKILIGTRKGFHIYDGKHMTPFPTKVDDFLAEERLYHGIRLYNGDFALATATGGLLVIDNNGNLKDIFNKAYGLQDEIVRFVYEDLEGNIWLALDKGLAKIENSSPFHFYYDRSGLAGSVTAIIRHNGSFYTGTTSGLFVKPANSNRFHRVPGISNTCWDLDVHAETLLATAMNGVYQVNSDGKTTQRILDEQAYVLKISDRHPGYAFCGTRSGLIVLIFKDNRWTESHRFKEINKQITAMEESQNGDLWISSNTGDVQKIVFRDNIKLKQPEITRFDESSGLQGSEIKMAHVANHLVFATETGLFKYDEQSNRFISDLTLGRQFAGGYEGVQEGKPVFRIIEDQSKNIWFHSESMNYMAALRPIGSPQLLSKPFLRLPTIQVNVIYPDPNGKQIWFGSLEGLIGYDTTAARKNHPQFKTLIKQVIVNNNMIYNGTQFTRNEYSKEHPPFQVAGYQRMDLRFEFAAPYFEAESKTQYQSKLEGYDMEWSAWSKEPKRFYTNIKAGTYTFRVRSQNIYRESGTEDIFHFELLPPWYLRWWAILFLGLTLSLLTVLVVKRRRSIKLEQEKQKLQRLVEESTVELRERTTEIENKNRQLEYQTLQLKKQSEKLKEMDSMKSRFFANISHEFRTPLTLIMSPLEQMLANCRNKEHENKFNTMMKNARRLLTLINQLLDLARFDNGKMKLHAARQNIVPFIEGILGSFLSIANQNRLKLEFQAEKKEIPAYFDAEKMEDVMYNLLFNAVKFTPPGGKVSISVSTIPPEKDAPDGDIIISIKDTGNGISEQQLPHIFDRFYQAETTGGKNHNGTGIGLALVREIITLHHGEINVHSSKGKGTHFLIRLLSGKTHLDPKELVLTPYTTYTASETRSPGDTIKNTYTLLEEENETDDENHLLNSGSETDNRLTEDNCTQKTDDKKGNVILIVEDNDEVREYIRAPLQSYYRVEEARDGKEGIAKAKAIIPDLIVSDIMMPEVDGCSLCKELKKNIATSHIPIILLTAKASLSSRINGFETGADDYITKPFNTPLLLTRIKNLIDLRRQMQLKIQRKKMLLPSEVTVSSTDQTFLKEFQDVIENQLGDPNFNVDVLCEKLYMARSTLFRKIQALTGETPNQFIQTYRLEKGATLLRGNYGNITEVAMATGFSSSQYFARCFREKFHQSPSEYKASVFKS
jgi:signal transduction histidine kinase/CheY-like chemotaxis protein/AraC-like DNA-binding protein